MKYPKNELFEKFADIEHQRWVNWQKYLHSKLFFHQSGSIEMSKELFERWERQIATDYKDLSEEEKNSDRKQVMRYYNLIR